MTHSWRKGILFLWLGFLTFLLLPGPVTAQEELSSPGKPLTLDQCVPIGLKIHPSLQSGQANVEATKATIEQVLAAYYPQLNFTGSYTASTINFSSNPYLNPGGGAVGVPITSLSRYNWAFTNGVSAGLTATQTIYDFGRTSNTVKINRENTSASEQDLITTNQTVVLNVKQAYYGVLQNLRLIQGAEDTVKAMRDHLAQENYELATGRYQVGVGSPLDGTDAEVLLAKANYITALYNYKI